MDHRLAKVIRVSLIMSVLLGWSGSSSALELNSGTKQTTLIELYTSEGCSSCPPADRWLSGLTDEEQLWKEIVPIALHVDYWDYIGWKDPFARHEYSQRQRRYASEFDEATVYTPGVRANGREWRRWWSNRLSAVQSETEIGNLGFNLDAESRFTADFSPENQSNAKLILNIAVLGMGLQSEVSRGENRGRLLNHDFVVLGLHKVAPQSPGSWSGTLPAPAKKADRYAIAAWVSEGRSQIPLQAVGGYLPESQFLNDQVSQ